MESKSQSANSTEERGARGLSRRELLKVLGAAGGGLTAAAFLPARWLKPVIESGVLPAHAQASCVLELSGLNVHCDGTGIGDHPHLFHYTGSINYSDSCCEVIPGNVSGEVWSDNQSAFEDAIGLRQGSTPCEGTVDFSFWADPPTTLHGIFTVNGRSEQIDIPLLPCTVID